MIEKPESISQQIRILEIIDMVYHRKLANIVLSIHLRQQE
jgi:hypothetical protein